MTNPGLLPSLVARVARRPLATVLVLLALAAIGAAAALSLRPSAGTDTLVSRSSATYRNTQRFYANFGEEPIEVLVKGNLRKLVLSSDLDRLVGLEGCLSGNVPVSALANEGGVNGPCGQLAHAKTVKVVFGPGTFLNEAVVQVEKTLAARSKQADHEAKLARETVYKTAIEHGVSVEEATTLAKQASKAQLAGFAAELSAIAIRYGLNGTPSLNEHEFISKVVFDSSKRAGTPKQRFAYLFPSSQSALISIRMKAGLSEAQRSHTIALIRKAVRMSQWHLANGESYLVTGEPVIVSDLSGSISKSIELLLLVVLIVMGLVLSLIFKGRPRLLPLLLALLTSALAFGALAISGASLTMASVAVLPVLIGLSVDYAIQFQSRVQEERSLGAPSMPAALSAAAVKGAGAIAAAALASIGGLLVLLLSPVPMVRGFGLLLVVGVALAFLVALSAGAATLVLYARRESRAAGAKEGGIGGPELGSLAAAWRGASELLTENPLSRQFSRLALQRAVRRPERVLLIGLALAVLGWGLDTQTQVQTDISKLAPQNLASLQSLDEVERVSGVGGEIDLMVSSNALTKPATIEWMSSYEAEILKRFGYSTSKGCGQAELCPAFSLPDLFSEGEGTAGKLTEKRVSGLLRTIPPYFSQDVITADRKVATLAFGIRLMSLQRQQQVIEGMQESLHPPRGVQAHVVGLSVLAAQSGAQLASPWRRVLTLLIALVVVAAILLVLFKGDRRRALVPMVPVVLATGWSALILFLTRVPLNPMSVTLGALVIAISTEFSVLLSERQLQERRAGHSTVQALRRAYSHTGAAVAASGVTAIVGFGVLVFSDIAMLRDFGLVTLIDLSVSLLGVLIALPAAIVLAEGEQSPQVILRAALRWPAPLGSRRRGLTEP